jgi:hypothetical protein
MSLSTVIVAINAKLLQRTGRRPAQGSGEGDALADKEVAHLNY